MIVVWLASKPPYPKEVHTANLSSIPNLRMCSINLGMIDADDPSIPKHITAFIKLVGWHSNHDIRAGGRMDCVWFSVNVIWCVIKVTSLHQIYLVTQNTNRLAFRWCKCPMSVSIKVMSKQLTKKMLLKFRKKVLIYFGSVWLSANLVDLDSLWVQDHHLLHFYGASDKAEQLCFEMMIYSIANHDHRPRLLEEGGRTNVDAVASPASDDVP